MFDKKMRHFVAITVSCKGHTISVTLWICDVSFLLLLFVVIAKFRSSKTGKFGPSKYAIFLLLVI